MPKSDQELINDIKSGENKSFRILVERHKDRAFTLALRYLKQPADAEEALQDAFLRAFQGLEEFRGEAKFSTWFYRILYNVCMTRLGRNKHEVESYSMQEEGKEECSSQIASDDFLPDQVLEQKEFQAMIGREIEKMPEHYRAILTLYYVQELSYEEMGEVLQLPPGTIKTHLFRGRSLLRSKVIQKYYTEVKSV